MVKLEDLRPTEKQLVIEIVNGVGISTDDWKGNDDPSRRSNWCFGSVGKPNVAFVWFDGLHENDGQIFFINDSTGRADQYRRDGQPLRAKRADEFDRLINQSYYQRKPIRIAIVSGDHYDNDEEKVRQRVLDHELWYPHHRDPDSGNIVVVRGVPQPDDFDPSAEYSGGFLKHSQAPKPAQSQLPVAQQPPLASGSEPEQPLRSQPQNQDFEESIPSEIFSDEDNFDPGSVEDARKWINASIVRRQGQGKFRADVLAAYGNRCAISACNVPEALEAAHIFGYMGGETNVVTNGLLLRSDLHTLYDRGLIAIDPASMKVLIAPRLKGGDYGYLEGRAIRLPLKAEQRPNHTALEMHVTWAKKIWK